jgi:dTDP-4-dehydrorhamnose 3,5-epimerase
VKFTPTKIAGVWVVELERHTDERGFFARLWCPEEFASHGLNPRLSQCSMSYNRQQGTVRGMHYQAEPFAEAKLVRCGRGAIFDVALDLRPASQTYGQWEGVGLSSDNRTMLYIPEGCAHGFQTLSAEADVNYYISERYRPESARGVRWNDPAFNVTWPLPVRTIAGRDSLWPLV